MRWLVTGANGMLGTDLVDLLRSQGEDVTAASRSTLDVTAADAVADAVAGHDVVVNCAAWTAVDDAEEHEGEALVVNAEAPRLLARAAAASGARLVQVSTDYVFDGSADTPYPEDAQLSPVSAYGRTKAAGETAVRDEHPGGHLVVRTAWLYGAHGGCFPKTIARVARERGEVRVVDDQVGQPTWTADVAATIVASRSAGEATEDKVMRPLPRPTPRPPTPLPGDQGCVAQRHRRSPTPLAASRPAPSSRGRR